MIIYNTTFNVAPGFEGPFIEFLKQEYILDCLNTKLVRNPKFMKLLGDLPDEGSTYSLQFDCSNTLQNYTVPVDVQLPAGTYWIKVMGHKKGNTGDLLPIFNSTCATAYPYNDTKIPSVISVDKMLDRGGNAYKNEAGHIANMKFQVGNPASCGRVWVCAVCTTPVTYTYFNVYPTEEHQVLISWGTANETQNKKFVIEASADGVNFHVIGEKLGANTTNTQRDYSFVHVLETAGKQYYRIKQVDLDGTTSYTAVKYVSLNAADAVVSAYPQPIKQGETLQVEINGLSGASLSFKLVDISGALISNGALEIAEDENTFGINTSNLKAGVYLLTLSNEDLIKTIRVVVE